MATRIKFGLSVSEVQNAIAQVEKYKSELIIKCRIFAERLAEQGIFIAKVKLAEHNAIYSGELISSIHTEYVTSTPTGAIWTYYTDCEWAPYVEFGFGVLGSSSPHPNTSLIGWKYDVNSHGEYGWFYQKDGEWHWSNGQPSKPFMYESAMELRMQITKIAREVFGK